MELRERAALRTGERCGIFSGGYVVQNFIFHGIVYQIKLLTVEPVVVDALEARRNEQVVQRYFPDIRTST